MGGDHGGEPRDWGRWRTVEGGFLVDRRAVREAAVDAGCGWPAEGREEDALRQALIALLERGVERCRHGLPLGVDLAIPEPFEPVPGLRIAGDTDTGADIYLLAGPAMGSGRAPWTRALLRALSRHLAPQTRVADVGTGTGILALYALRRDATHVDAVDVDPLAAAIARRNARVNGLAARVGVAVGSAEQLGESYDLAIVSLGAVAELEAVLAETARRLRPGGTLIASPAEGVDESEQLILLLGELGLGLAEVIEEEDWYVAVARR